MMDYVKLLGGNALAALNLHQEPNGVSIRWPDDVNIYHMTLGKHLGPASRDKTAMIFESEDGSSQSWSFAQIEEQAVNLAASLRHLGYGSGDFIGIHTGQHPDTAVAHMAVCKLGAVAVTLSQLYGPDSLAHAIADCGLRILLTGAGVWAGLRAEQGDLFPSLDHVMLRAPDVGELDLGAAIDGGADNPTSKDFVPSYGGSDDPALLMYTSGSTGRPKGIMHGHRVLASYTPSINLFFNMSMEDDDAVYWSPSDWAWVGGLLDMLFPAWMAGRPIVTSLDRFKADWAYQFITRHRVTHSFLAPTAIKRLAETPDPKALYDLAIRVICTGGEALAAETLNWAENKLGVVCNEFYGMTEVNHLIGNCAQIYPRRPGSMGQAYPGHQVLLVDDTGTPVADGDVGEIVTSNAAPTRFLGYYNAPEKEAEMRLGPYLRTRDLAIRDADGYFWYKGRSDDLIKSSGFRIGPTEIEECLIGHPAVGEAAVIGKPDAARGAIVKAFVKLQADIPASDDLKAELVDHVRTRLAGYKAPRELEFVDSFVMTSSAKINRRALRDAEVKKTGGVE